MKFGQSVFPHAEKFNSSGVRANPLKNMEENLALAQSIGRGLETCGKGLDIIGDTVDALSRKRNITVGDIFFSALKITVGGVIYYASAESVRHDVVQFTRNIGAGVQKEIATQRLIDSRQFTHPNTLL